jgi:FAD/FMN-containing dehydrogenase
VAWPMDEAPQVLRFLREFMAEAPDEVGVMANLRLAPSLPIVPEELRGKPIVALIVTYAGPVEEGREVLGPIRQLPTPVLDGLTAKPYSAHQKMFDAAFPHGRHYYWKAHKLGPLSDEIIDVVVEHAEQVTSPLSAIPIFCFGGAVARVPEEATAFSYRDASHDLNVVAAWLPGEAGDADRHIEWVHKAFAALEPYGRGVYVNFTGDDAAERVRQAYTDGHWARLTALKAEYDPTNFFRMNANIPPA